MTDEMQIGCTCGSGRPPARCHEMPPRLALAAREELRALGEAHDVGAYFPWVRPEPGALDAILDVTLGRLGVIRGLSAGLHAAVEEVVEHMDDDQRRAISVEWRDRYPDRYPDRWRRLARATRDEEPLERCFAASAVRAAILERQPFDPELADELDDFPSTMALSAALSLVIHPALVWDRDDAALALDAFPRFRLDELEIAEKYAPAIVGDAHLERVRGRVANVAAALPLERRARASRLLERAAREVSADEDHQFHLACLLLQGYASSLWHEETVRLAVTGRSSSPGRRGGHLA